MAKHIVDPTKASYEANTLLIQTGELHAQLLSYLNQTHEAVANGDKPALAEMRKVVPEVLSRFERSECENYENPTWLGNKMRAGWHVALGEFDKAYEYELAGWRAATSEPEMQSNRDTRTKRVSISASNLADQLLRMGRASEALPWAKASVELWPSNTVNHLVFGQVLYHVGMKKQADFVIEQLRQLAQFGDSRDVLSKCMAYERALQDMADLQSVKRLFKDMRK